MDVVHAQPDRQRLKMVIAERLNISPGDRVLDVGCGTGNDVRMLASLVGPTGWVTGIDLSKTMIVAHERSRASSLPVSFALGDARSLDFPDNPFDACRCETVLMHLDGSPARAIAEMARVTPLPRSRCGRRLPLGRWSSTTPREAAPAKLCTPRATRSATAGSVASCRA
jgi:ubiquinone/menaquinone biosynthesis C-methylase UbiE